MITGIGIDIVDNERMALAIKRHPKIIEKILTAKEIEDLGLSQDISRTDVYSIAARFAAKEALSKALGAIPFAIGFQNIELTKQPNGAPEIQVFNQEYKDYQFLCSLTHSRQSSAAVVIAQS